jgi:hypothetical protein
VFWYIIPLPTFELSNHQHSKLERNTRKRERIVQVPFKTGWRECPNPTLPLIAASFFLKHFFLTAPSLSDTPLSFCFEMTCLLYHCQLPPSKRCVPWVFMMPTTTTTTRSLRMPRCIFLPCLPYDMHLAFFFLESYLYPISHPASRTLCRNIVPSRHFCPEQRC